METALTTPATVRYRNLVWDSARWEGFTFRDGDIVISTPPKSGTTWMQMICALLIFQRAQLPARLDELSPWMDMQTRTVAEVHARLDAQTHRRFIKTHTPLDGLPWNERVTYILVGRDPRDVALSWDNHWTNLDLDKFFAARARAVGTDDLAELMPDGPPPPAPEDPAERYWAFVEDARPVHVTPAPSVASTVQHLRTFWAVRNRPNVVLVHYADLQADLEGQMRALAARLGIAVPDDRWPELIAAAGFDRMRARATELVPESGWMPWRDSTRFFHSGAGGRWRALHGASGAARYAAAEDLADADLLDWAHAGTDWR